MAGKAIVARLELNSSDYEKKLAAAKKKTADFSKGGGTDLAAMAGQFKTLAVAVAGSKAAMEVFNRVVQSSQTIGDTYASTMNTAKSVTDQFVYALANADFSRFNSGLNDVISKSRDAYNALDQLGNTQISYGYITGRNRAALRENLLKVRDTNLPMAERREAYANAQRIYDEIKAQTGTYKATTEQYIKSALADVSGLMAESIKMDDFVQALMVDIGADPASARKMIQEQYAMYQREAARIGEYSNMTTANKYGQLVANVNYDPERAKAEMATLNESNRSMLVAYNLLFKYTDEELKKLTGYLTQADNAEYAMGEFATQIREAGNALNQPVKAGTVGAALKLTGEQYAQSFGLNYWANLSNPLARKAAQGVQPIHDVPIIDTTLETEALPTIKKDVKEVAKDAYTAADGIYAIGGALGSLSGVMGDNASQWLNWGATVLSAVGQFASAAASGGGLGLITPAASLLSSFLGVPSLGGMGGGNVQFKIKGSDLVGSISNFNNIASRSYGN